MGVLGIRGLQGEAGVRLSTEKLFPLLLMLLGFDRFHLTIVARIAFGSREGQHDDVLPVAPFLLLRYWQLNVHLLAAHNIRPRIAQVAHGLLGLNPRSAAHGPARTGLQAEAQSQTMRFLGRVANQRLPLRTQALDMFLRARPVGRVAHLSVEELHTLDTRSGDGLEVAGDALATNAAIEEVEPRLGIVDASRMQESILVTLRKRTL